MAQESLVQCKRLNVWTFFLYLGEEKKVESVREHARAGMQEMKIYLIETMMLAHDIQPHF